MARKQDAYYFDNFVACAEESCQAAALLRRVLGDFKPEELEKYLEEIHEIENRADGKKHDMLDKLATSDDAVTAAEAKQAKAILTKNKSTESSG